MKSPPGRLVLAVATTVVGASIVAGVFVVGTPARGRLESLDADRIEDLQGIMRAVDRFWTDHERLPETLVELAEDPRFQANTVDPGSTESYEYHVRGDETYALCAVFDRESRAPRRAPEDFWSHGVGRRCFELDVGRSDRVTVDE
ncbi:MAG: hypothetical protein HKP01_08140 [Gemmatimonadetes bacterium]|nr:hypothetical protein [Gemmatimonadota bacterium]